MLYMYVCNVLTVEIESLDVYKVRFWYACTFSKYPSQVRISRSSGQGQGHRNIKNVSYTCPVRTLNLECLDLERLCLIRRYVYLGQGRALRSRVKVKITGAKMQLCCSRPGCLPSTERQSCFNLTSKYVNLGVFNWRLKFATLTVLGQSQFCNQFGANLGEVHGAETVQGLSFGGLATGWLIR